MIAPLDTAQDKLAETITQRGVPCPHCKEPLTFEMVAKAAAETELSFKLTPRPGEMLDLETIGGSLSNFSKLLKAVGKSIDHKTMVMLKRTTTHDDGALEFIVQICRSTK
jgi:hypothetical protein